MDIFVTQINGCSLMAATGIHHPKKVYNEIYGAMRSPYGKRKTIFFRLVLKILSFGGDNHE